MEPAPDCGAPLVAAATATTALPRMPEYSAFHVVVAAGFGAADADTRPVSRQTLPVPASVCMSVVRCKNTNGQ